MGEHIRMECLDQMFIFLGNCFPEWLCHFASPLAVLGMVQFLHILINTWCGQFFNLAILKGAQWYPIVLICISL